METAQEETKAAAQLPVHEGYYCDHCHAYPIVGTRYACANCTSYDLCEQCEALDLHDHTHVFLKIRRPLPRPIFAPTAPLLPHILYSPAPQQNH